jgi:hypothetical protein
MHALSKPLRSGEDVPRVIAIDELNLHLAHESVGEYLLEGAALLRHLPNTYIIGGQRTEDLIQGVLSLVTVVVQFHTPNGADFGKLKERVGMMGRTSYREHIMDLKKGQAVIGAVVASDSDYSCAAQEVELRPSVLWTAGETLVVG